MNERQLEINLNNAWWGHGDTKYEDELSFVKMMGYKVFRDSHGNHKIQKSNNSSMEDMLSSLFFNGGK